MDPQLPGWAFLPFLAVGGLIALSGLAIAARSVVAIRRSAALTRVGVPTTATIIDSQVESRTSTTDIGMPNADGTPGMQTPSTSYLVFRPIVRFRTQTGQEITAVAPRVSRRSFLPGAAVEVLYNPSRPDQLKIVSGPGSGGSAVPGMVAGLVMAAIATTFVILVHSIFFMSPSPASTDPGCPPGISCTTP